MISKHVGLVIHDPDNREELGFIATSAENQPVYLNRAIQDADVVFPIGCLRPRASLAYHGIHTVLFPTYADRGTPSEIKVLDPEHPITKGLPARFELPETEMYADPFQVPEPDAVLFEESWKKGETFRSGLIWNLGEGKVFYFRPGHETYPTYHDANVRRVIANAVRWAHNPARRIADPSAAPNVPVDKAPEKITERGARLHNPGEDGFR